MIWLAYTRVSRVGDRGEHLVSPELQRSRIDAYASAHGLEVEHLPPELDVSGGKVRRPILEQALQRVEAGEAAGIIVAQLDRLSRLDIADALGVIKRIESGGGRVIAVAENFDAATPEGRLARNVMLSLGEMQLSRYRLQFEAARRQAVERGIWIGAKVPIGYTKGADRRLVPSGDAPKVRRAFELRAQGARWSDVGQIMGRSASAAQWIIANRVYLGEVGIEIAGEVVTNPKAHEPIIDRGLFEAAQLSNPPSYKGRGAPALLGGLVRCEGCGDLMPPSRRSYSCTSWNKPKRCGAPASILRERVEQFTVEAIFSNIEGTITDRPKTTRTDEAERALAEAEAELVAFQGATKAAEVGAEHFASGMRERVDAVERARGELGRVRATVDIGAVLNPREFWDGLDGLARRHLLRSLLSGVWVRSSGRRDVPASERVRILDLDGDVVQPVGLRQVGGRGEG